MKNINKLFVFGSGGAFKEISYLITKNNLFEIVIVLENKKSEIIENLLYDTIKENIFFDNYMDKEVSVGVFIGDTKSRERIVNLIKSRTELVNFPSFNFSKYLNSVHLNEGNIIMPGCVFTEKNVDIGSFNYFNFNCFVAHDVSIKSFNTFSPFAKVSGNCKILDNNFFGTGCILFPNITVDKSSIGAGAVVKKKMLINKIVDIPKSNVYDKR
jgi:acetyltransferase-like isoleucine patch superfamily enzyme